MLTPPPQERIAEIVNGLPEARGFALAGAGGLLARGFIERSTRDLDYFTTPGEEEALRMLEQEWSRGLSANCYSARGYPGGAGEKAALRLNLDGTWSPPDVDKMN